MKPKLTKTIVIRNAHNRRIRYYFRAHYNFKLCRCQNLKTVCRSAEIIVAEHNSSILPFLDLLGADERVGAQINDRAVRNNQFLIELITALYILRIYPSGIFSLI